MTVAELPSSLAPARSVDADRLDVACGRGDVEDAELFGTSLETAGSAATAAAATISSLLEDDSGEQQQQQQQQDQRAANKQARRMVRKIRKKGRKKYRMLFFLAGFAVIALLTFLGVLTPGHDGKTPSSRSEQGLVGVDYAFATTGGAASPTVSLRMLSTNASNSTSPPSTQRNCTAIQDTKMEKIAYPTSLLDTLTTASKDQLAADKADFCWCETTSVALNGSRADEVSTYPKDMFTLQERQSGAILLHIILMLCCFYGLAEM